MVNKSFIRKTVAILALLVLIQSLNLFYLIRQESLLEEEIEIIGM
ncbi:MAG: hypothetical protein V4487_08575 [Chlamydiota bacterium]